MRKNNPILNLKASIRALEMVRRRKKLTAKFNLGFWGAMPKKMKRKPKPDITCATAACAFGYIALSGEVPSLRFRIVGCDLQPFVHGIGIGSSTEGFDAAGYLYDINLLEAKYLFAPSSYSRKTGAKALDLVLGRLKALLRVKEIEAATMSLLAEHGEIIRKHGVFDGVFDSGKV